MKKIRSYFIDPPTMPKIAGLYGKEQGILEYSLPPFMYKRKFQNPVLKYLVDVVEWAEKEYNEARLFYASSGNNARLAWILSLKAEHVLARSWFVPIIFDLFEKNSEIWQSLDVFEQNFFVEAWKIWNFEKAPIDAERIEERRKRQKPTRASLPRYDIALMELAIFNKAYPGELTQKQLTDAAIAGAK